MAEQFTLEDNELVETIDPKDLDMAAQIQEVVHSFEGDVVNVKCKLYKIEKGRRRWLYDAMPVELGDVQNALKNEYGPGLYENHVYINGRLDQRLKLDIGETLADRFPGRIPPADDKGLRSSDILALVREMNANQAEQNRLMMERMENTIKTVVPQQSAQAPINPLDLQTSILAMMVQMKEILGPNQAAPSTDPIDTISRVVELIPTMQAITGEGGTAPVMASLAKEFLPRLMDLAKLQPTPPDPQAPLTPDQVSHMANAHTQAVTNQTPPQSKAQPGDKTEMLNKFIVNKALGFLLTAAERDFSPVTYAELLIDQAQVYGMEQEVINFILADGAINALYEINPKVGTYKAWFEQLIEAVKEMVTEVPEEGSEATNEPHLTGAEVTPISTLDASIPTEQKPTVADSRRGVGNQGNITPDVESG